MELIEHPPIFRIPGIPDQVLYMWFVMGILLVVAVVATRRLQLVPRGSQNFMEIVLDQFVNELDETIGHDGRHYLPLVATLGLFILVSNLMGLVPGLIATTANLNTTAACALIVFFTYHVIGVRKQGLIPYLKHFAGPVPGPLKPLMFVIEVISHLARPLSLSLRLFGNIFAGGVLVHTMLGIAPFIMFIFLGLELFVGAIQALIFTMLSLVFLSIANTGHGHDPHDPGHTNETQEEEYAEMRYAEMREAHH